MQDVTRQTFPLTSPQREIWFDQILHHLFRVQDKTSGADESESEGQRPAWGWGKYTHADVIEHRVPGAHFTMMTAPHVQTLATAIQACLRKMCDDQVFQYVEQESPLC